VSSKWFPVGAVEKEERHDTTMQPQVVQYEGRLLMQVPIEWRGNHLHALMDAKLVALVSATEPISYSHNYMCDFRGEEEAIADCALKELAKYRVAATRAAAEAADPEMQPITVQYGARSVIQVCYCDSAGRFCAHYHSNEHAHPVADDYILALLRHNGYPEGAAAPCWDEPFPDPTSPALAIYKHEELDGYYIAYSEAQRDALGASGLKTNLLWLFPEGLTEAGERLCRRSGRLTR
jgi:hypothetical protein